MPITYTPEQRKKLDELGLDYNLEDGDASQATMLVLGLSIQKEIGEKLYTVLIVDWPNLEKPVAADISVLPDGTVQAHEVDLFDIWTEYGIEELEKFVPTPEEFMAKLKDVIKKAFAEREKRRSSQA